MTISEMLDAKIPREVISDRDGGGGRRLSYLEGWYVIDRLNKVFGPGGWSKEITDVRQLGTANAKPSYIVKVRLTVIVDGTAVVKEGYGYGSDKSANNPHELAIKEAVTDALKVAAKDLGMSMGLALYDRSQENVDDGQEKEAHKPVPVAKAMDKPEVQSQVLVSPPDQGGQLRKYIQNASKIAMKKGLSLEDLKKSFKDKFGFDKLSDVSEVEKLLEVKKHIDSLI